MFWLLFTITLYLILVSPLEFASFVRDTNATVLRFLRSFAAFFRELHT
ncbi:hypothetical protein [Streptomyces eurythermus]